MKKLLFILTLFISISSFAQTKEETVAWLNTYASVLLPYHNISVNENDELLIESGKKKSDYIGKSIIPLKDILITEKIEEKFLDNKASFWHKIVTNGKVITFVGFEGDVHPNNTAETTIYSYKKNDLERAVKAINHLAKLCGAKEKPKENTF